MVADGSSSDAMRSSARAEGLETCVRRLARSSRAFRRRLAALALALLVGLATTTVSAQTHGGTARSWWSRPVVDTAPETAPSPREVLLGTITTRKSEPQDRSTVADQILADGLEALHRGDVMLGRRRLEAVIDAYPDSAAAASAREELSILYNIRGRNAPAAGGGEPTARWIPAQNSSRHDRSSSEVQGIGSAAQDDRSSFSKEVRARERQNRRDERWLRSLSFDFQMTAGDRVFFAESSTDIGARARAVLAAQARWLLRHPGLPVVVEAHADDHRGNSDLDVQISERRARAVRERLIEEGVDASRITIIAAGRDRPVAICHAPECAAQNRRVITHVGSVADLDTARRGVEEPALAVAPQRSGPARRD